MRYILTIRTEDNKRHIVRRSHEYHLLQSEGQRLASQGKQVEIYRGNWKLAEVINAADPLAGIKADVIKTLGIEIGSDEYYILMNI